MSVEYTQPRLVGSPSRQRLRPRSPMPSLGVRLALVGMNRLLPRLAEVLPIATSFVSHSLSSAHFVCGLPLGRFYRDYLGWRSAIWALSPGFSVEIDPTGHEVRTKLFGFADQTVRHHPLFGSLAIHGDGDAATRALPGEMPAARAAGPLAVAAGDDRIVEPVDPALAQALEAAIGRRRGLPAHGTKAILIARGDRVIAEAYAEGYGPQTPIVGYSLTKALGNALVGRMVERGLLSLDEPALCDEWSGRGDPRRAITADHLLRMTSGLGIAETHSGFDPVSRMLFLTADMGAFAAGAPLEVAPGTRFSYTSANTLILARHIRDRLGGTMGDTWRFLDRELLAPLGMERMLVEYDATGTPILSTFGYATARDWARLGLLYLNDGCVGGRRLLPAGWVGYSTSPTVEPTYGAAFRVNRAVGTKAKWLLAGVPADAYFAHGHLGQFLVVVPSHDLVVVRLGAARTGFHHQTARLVREVIAALSR